MPYNFDLAVSASISAKVAEEMVKRIVEEQTGKTVAKIETRLRRVTKGIGPSETTETVFDGYHVLFEDEKSSTKVNKKAEFVKAEYT